MRHSPGDNGVPSPSALEVIWPGLCVILSTVAQGSTLSKVTSWQVAKVDVIPLFDHLPRWATYPPHDLQLMKSKTKQNSINNVLLKGAGHILGSLSRTESCSLLIPCSWSQQASELGLTSGIMSSPSHLPMGLSTLTEAQLSSWELCCPCNLFYRWGG